MSEKVCITVTRQERYRFLVDFGAGIAEAVGDEPPPLGEGAGPSPSQLLAAAVANCLSSSLVFATNKFKEDPGPLATQVTCEIGRNDRNRLRILGMHVEMTLGAAPESLTHLERALAQFEDFCTVSQSVRAGIPFTVTVKGPDGRVLK
jgi:uncharacterized OsmC-like protein